MSLLTREQILGAHDLKREPIELPEWGGAAYVREFTGSEREVFEQYATRYSQGEVISDIRARVAAWCLVDEQGKRIFTDDDIAVLTGKSPRPLVRIFNAVLRLSALTSEGQEQIEKNSATPPENDSGTN